MGTSADTNSVTDIQLMLKRQVIWPVKYAPTGVHLQTRNDGYRGICTEQASNEAPLVKPVPHATMVGNVRASSLEVDDGHL